MGHLFVRVGTAAVTSSAKRCIILSCMQMLANNNQYSLVYGVARLVKGYQL